MLSETYLISPSHNLNTQIQSSVNSQMDKYKQLTADEQPTNEFDPNQLDPVVKIPFEELYLSLHFCTERQRILFISAFINWNQCLLQIYDLKRNNKILQTCQNPIMSNSNSVMQMSISKRHEIDYDQQSPINLSKSFFDDSNLYQKNLEGLQHVMIERTTQTEFAVNREDASIDPYIDYQQDELQIKDFFESQLYKDLKKKQFLINAQIMSIIQTIFIANESTLYVHQQIRDEIELIIKQFQKLDPVSKKTLTLMQNMIK